MCLLKAPGVEQQRWPCSPGTIIAFWLWQNWEVKKMQKKRNKVGGSEQRKRRKRLVQRSWIHPCVSPIQSLLPSGLSLLCFSLWISFWGFSRGALSEKGLILPILPVLFDSCWRLAWVRTDRPKDVLTAAPLSHHTRPQERLGYAEADKSSFLIHEKLCLIGSSLGLEINWHTSRATDRNAFAWRWPSSALQNISHDPDGSNETISRLLSPLLRTFIALLPPLQR